jgi:hypothetical protein
MEAPHIINYRDVVARAFAARVLPVLANAGDELLREGQLLVDDRRVRCV